MYKYMTYEDLLVPHFFFFLHSTCFLIVNADDKIYYWIPALTICV